MIDFTVKQHSFLSHKEMTNAIRYVIKYRR